LEKEYPKIKDGVTVDHILPGKALDILKTLGITPESGNPIIVLMNVKSAKMGKKDLIKLENVKLDPKKVAAEIKKIAPKATVNLIKNYEVIQKVKV
jgi:aspartate carbamoyltransferase regulatory subunit